MESLHEVGGWLAGRGQVLWVRGAFPIYLKHFPRGLVTSRAASAGAMHRGVRFVILSVHQGLADAPGPWLLFAVSGQLFAEVAGSCQEMGYPLICSYLVMNLLLCQLLSLASFRGRLFAPISCVWGLSFLKGILAGY